MDELALKQREIENVQAGKNDWIKSNEKYQKLRKLFEATEIERKAEIEKIKTNHEGENKRFRKLLEVTEIQRKAEIERIKTNHNDELVLKQREIENLQAEKNDWVKFNEKYQK